MIIIIIIIIKIIISLLLSLLSLWNIIMIICSSARVTSGLVWGADIKEGPFEN